jgi:hypothetical protein
MKRFIIIMASLALFPLGAAAQSRAVERFAAKWEDRESVSVVTINGVIGKGARINGVEGVDIARFISDISGITIVSNERPDDEFVADLRRIVAEGDYTKFMTVSEGGEKVEILYANQPGAGGRKELLITVSSSDEMTLISVTGKINIKHNN